MIYLNDSFNLTINQIFDNLHFPRENEVSYSVQEVDTKRYIREYNIPSKARYLGVIWVEDYILFFEKDRFIGYVVDGEFKNERCDLHPFEPYTAKIRNKLSPVYNFVQLFELWMEEQNPELKEQQFQILQNELLKSKNNFQKIFHYLNQINLNFE